LTNLEYQLTKELEGRLETVVQGLSNGAPTDYSEYCRMVGEIRGLRHGLAALAHIRQQIGAEDE
jgi:hypothetical protein